MKKTTPAETTDAACPPMTEAVAYLRDELDAARRTALERHLAICDVCRAETDRFRQTIERILAAAPRQPCRDLYPAIAAELKEQKHGRTKIKRLVFRPTLLKAAAWLAVLGGALFWQTRSGLSPERAGRAAPAASAQVVSEALAWLASVQSENGAWNPAAWGGRQDYETALTGLTLLTFLRHADVAPPNLRDATRRGMRHLLSQQRADGGFGPRAAGHMYNHGIATAALLEARRQGLAADAHSETALRAALAFLGDQQHQNGGWGYDRNPATQPNTSVTAWQMEALALALETGYEEWTPTFEKGLQWLHTMAGGGGRFGYQQSGDTSEHSALNAMGAHCLFRAAANAAGESVDRNLAQLALERAVAESADDAPDYYRSYFLSSALKASAHPRHLLKRAQLQANLSRERNRSVALGGSWNPSDQWGPVGGRIYATAMATLALR